MIDIEKNIAFLKDQLDYIKQIDANDELAYERTHLAFRNIRWLPIFSKIIPTKSTIFRARTHTDKKWFLNKKEVSNPPNKFIPKFGRLNRPFQSVFYGAENRPTSYMELVEYWAEEMEIGSEISVSLGMWEFQRDLNVMIIPRPYIADRKTTAEIEYGRQYDDFLSNGKFNELGKKSSNIIFDFMSKEYMRPAKKDKKTYITTSAYSNLIMLKEDLDGILYPSVPFGGNGYNLALKSKLVYDGSIKLTEVTKDTFNIGLTDEGKHSFNHIETISTNKINKESGEIRWD